MKTIEIKSKEITLTAVLKDNLLELGKSKKNQATDIVVDEVKHDGYWCLIFDMGNVIYEAAFIFDKYDYCQTLKPIRLVTWENDMIVDMQEASVSIK